MVKTRIVKKGNFYTAQFKKCFVWWDCIERVAGIRQVASFTSFDEAADFLHNIKEFVVWESY